MPKNILLFTVFALIWVNYNVSELKAEVGVLSGSVANNNGAYIIEASIVINDLVKKKSYSLTTNENGEYEISLIPSVYEIEVKKVGFCPLIRPPFELGSNEKINIKLNLLVCATESIVVIAKEKEKSGIISRYRIPYKEDNLIIDEKRTLTGNARIQYGEKNFLNGKINYEKIVLTSNTSAPVSLSYNTIQIYATSLLLERSNIFTAKGNVIFEDGKNCLSLEEVKFSLKDGKYKILSSKTKIDLKEH